MRPKAAACIWSKLDGVKDPCPKVLNWFGATKGNYSVVFTANATASLKLVGEVLPPPAPQRKCVHQSSRASPSIIVA